MLKPRKIIITVLVVLFVPLAWFFVVLNRLNKKSEVENLDLDFIKQFETGSMKPTLTLFINKIDGNLEGGFGHVFNKLFWSPGQNITEDDAERFFQNDVRNAVRVYGNSIEWERLTSNQKRAIISHAYNTGAKSATIVRYVNLGDFTYLKEWWTKHYITSKGVFYEGLKRRRQFEADLL